MKVISLDCGPNFSDHYKPIDFEDSDSDDDEDLTVSGTMTEAQLVLGCSYFGDLEDRVPLPLKPVLERLHFMRNLFK
jgi:hypothetical protein